ncbi:MAG: PDZ domain-containing protein [Pyrinomonadaceae bacterium]
MKPKALPLAAFALMAASTVSAQTKAPAPPAQPARAAAPSTPAPPAAVAAVPRAAAAPHAPSVPQSPAAAPPQSPAAAPRAAHAAPRPAVAPEQPTPPQQAPAPSPPAVATTFYISGTFLGVRTEEVTRENMQRYGLSGAPRGVGVGEVVKGSPAEKAGLKANDVIVRFDGEQVTSVRKLTRLISESAPDHVVRLTVLRGGAEQELSATLARREPFVSAGGEGLFNISPEAFGDAMRLGDEAARNTEQWKRAQEQMQRKWEGMAQKHPSLFGSTRRIGVATNVLGKQLADYFGVTHGVLVSSVEENSPAARAGIKAGDIVTEADGQKVEDADDLGRALSAKEEGEVTLTVVRERNRRTVRVTPERRAAPQTFFTPGTFRVFESPVAATTLPRIMMQPEVFNAPNAAVPPRLLNAPRLRVTPRARVFGLGDRVL